MKNEGWSEENGVGEEGIGCRRGVFGLGFRVFRLSRLKPAELRSWRHLTGLSSQASARLKHLELRSSGFVREVGVGIRCQ
jgi:hypothetical protein